MTTRSRTKTEHNGAKNGGGYRGKRADAKRISNRKRREDGKSDALAGLMYERDFVASLVDIGETPSRFAVSDLIQAIDDLALLLLDDS